MNIENFKTLAKDIIDMARKKGADTIEVSMNDIQNFDVSVRKGEIESLQEAGSSNVNIVMTKNKKRSVVSSCDLKPESIEKLIDDGIKLANYSEADEFLTLPPVEELGSVNMDLKKYDDKLDSISAAQKIKLAKDLEAVTLKLDNRLNSDSSGVSTSKAIRVFANSLGFCEGYSGTNSSIGMSVFIDDKGTGENTNKKQSDGWFSSNIFYDKLDSIEEVAKIAAERTLRKLGARKPKTQTVPVIFDPLMGASFISSVASATMGGSIFRKQSFLIDQIEKKLGSEHFTLIDNPLIPGKLGSRPFDGEGVKSRENIIFKNGVFKKYLLDTYSANKLKLRTTGNSGGTSNLYLENGKYPVEELIAGVKNGLYLTSMSGQGANIITGDYSRGAQGIWIENGKLSYSVNEFTITSKFFDMMNNILMVGNDLKFVFNTNSPSFKIEQMTISGS
jgi:PmbA protein